MTSPAADAPGDTQLADLTAPPGGPGGAAPFVERALAAMGRRGPLCLGLDPSPTLLKRWGLPDDPDGLRACCDLVLDAAGDRVGLVKPQAAYFERFGAAGVAVLEQVLAQLRESGIVSILDAKRGDIGSTMTAYAQAMLGPSAPLRADAVTLSPYLGFESLRPALDLARATDSGVFVLALTSNPEGPEVQHLGEPALAHRIATAAARENAGNQPLGPVGLVVGATVGAAAAELGIDLHAMNGLILAPGLGAQGGTVADLAATFPDVGSRVVPVSSRGVLAAGPDRAALADACEALNEQLVNALST